MANHSGVLAERPTRRHFLQLSAAGIAALGVGACSRAGSTGSSATGVVTLSLTSDLTDMMKAPLAIFEKQHNAKVNLRIMPSDTGQYFDAIRTQFQAGSSDIDVIAGDVSWPAQLGANGWLKDLSGLFPAGNRNPYLPATIAANEYKGKVYGVPWYTDSGFLYYRQDLLDASGYSGPPATWDELQEMAAKVQRDSHVRTGLVFQGAQYEGGSVNGQEFIRTCGGRVLDGSGKVVIGDAPSVKGLQIERSMVTRGTSPAGVAEYKEDESGGAFLTGNALFLRSWGYLYGAVSDPSQSKITTSQVGVAALPLVSHDIAPVNVGGGWNFYVNDATPNLDLAWALITYLSADEQQKTWAIKGSLLPTRAALYSDPDVLAAMPVAKAGASVVAETVTPPVSPYYSDMSSAMAKHFNASLRGSEEPEQAAAALQDELQTIVDKT